MNSYHKNKFSYKNICLIALRIIFGAVFVFSGTVKAIDPLGTTYKVTDYLTAMSITLPEWMSLIIAIVLCSFEFLIGINMLLGIRFKETTLAAFLIMAFMLPLTLWLAIANPVSDCGCFGDAIIIDNWTTFWKNVVLVILLCAIWALRRVHHPWVIGLTSWIITFTFFMLSVVICVYSLQHLPMLDFRPYHIGANIYEGMKLKEGEVPDQYETFFIYSKNGEEKKFTLDQAPYNDPAWTFVTQETTLIKKGASPAIHDFSIITQETDDITDSVLQDSNNTYLIIMYDLQKSNWNMVDKIKLLQKQAIKHHSNIMILTASEPNIIEAYQKAFDLNIPINLTDPITLKTIIRANPGVVVLQNATVKDKWNMRDQEKHLKHFTK